MELPEYLSGITVEKTAPPTSQACKDLPFHDLHPSAFEKFCCELLIRKSDTEQREKIVQIMPIGMSGQKQFGSDIFVMDNSSGNIVYSLYEVKRLKKYTKNDFDRTVKRFIENHHHWGFHVSEFNIFVSHNISAEQIASWQSDAKKLSNLGVNYTILSPSRYGRWLADKPELVYTYFHDSWVEILYGKKGLWHLQKYGIYKFEESLSWVDYESEELNIGNDDLHYINDHVKVHCYMPTLSRRQISCFFELRNGRFSHVMITLGNDDFILRYFYGVNSPLKARIRKFIMPYYNDSTRYVLDIGNCRIMVSEEEAECACKAFDNIWHDYRSRIHKIENTLKTKYFPPIAGFGKHVPLMRIKCGLWRIIKEFTDCHDCSDGSGTRNIFQYSRWIKVFTTHQTEDMECGEHCTLIPANYDSQWGNYCDVRDEIMILWQYPYNSYSDDLEKIGPRFLWDAKTAHDWVRDQLIPEALSWHKKTTAEKTLSSTIKAKLFSKDFKYTHENYVISNFHPIAGEDVEWDRDGSFTDFISDLQLFYSSSPETIYVDANSHRSVFAALYLIMKHSSSKDFNYLCGNVNYLGAKNMDELVSAVYEQSISQDQFCDSPFKMDCIFRSMLACLKDGSHLNQIEILGLVEKLQPITAFMNNQKMLMRQNIN